MSQQVPGPDYAVVLIPTLPLFIVSLLILAVGLMCIAYYFLYLKPETEAWKTTVQRWEDSLLDDMAAQETRIDVKCIPPEHIDRYKTQRVKVPGSKWSNIPI